MERSVSARQNIQNMFSGALAMVPGMTAQFGQGGPKMGGAQGTPGRYITHLEAHPQLLLHIGLALMAYSVLMIAGLFALQLACLDRQLKSRKISQLPSMPPLMTVEKRLFQLISAGLFLLTLSIASGLFFLEDMFAQGKSHKAILSILAWCVYVLLLWGHHTRGWRGRRVITLSLVGSVILTLAYFGSRFVKEVLLS